MRWLAYIFIFLLVLIACQSNKVAATADTVEPGLSEQDTSLSQQDPSLSQQDTIRIENEALEYEIIIIDVGFHPWLMTQRPMSYYTQSTLENINRRYVLEWNQRASNPTFYNSDLYQFLIDYDPRIDYGMEVNYLLYMYFEYFQMKYRQRLW